MFSPSMIRIYVLIILLLVSFVSGWAVNGWRMESKYSDLEREYKQAVLDAKFAQDKHDVERQWRLDETERANAATVSALDASTRVIRKEVVRYVLSSKGSCDLDAWWVQLHNSAATGTETVTDATSEFNATTRTALPVITNNYMTCRDTAAKLRGLQRWVSELVSYER